MRLFVALEVPPAWHEAAAALRDALRAALPRATAERLRMADDASLHVTLRFIGEVGEEALPPLRGALAERVPPLAVALRLGAAGTFGPPARTAAVWAGIEGDTEALTALAERVDGAVSASLGVPREERPYFPHLTLARLDRRSDASARRAIAEAVRGLAPPPPAPFVAHQCVLMRSHLNQRIGGRGGARYEVLSRHGSGGRA